MKAITLSILCLLLTAWSAPAQNAEQKEEVVVLTTRLGELVIYPYRDTPLHRANFLKLAREHVYDSTTFHRVITGFMVQGGDINSKDKDPNNDGQGDMGYTLPAEFLRKYVHKRGAVAGARQGDNVNPEKRSSGCQFYIVQGTKFADNDLDRMELQVEQMELQDFLVNEFMRRPEQQWIRTTNWAEVQKQYPDTIHKLNQKLGIMAHNEFLERSTPFKYTPEQRKFYREQGGAPHLDLGYTVFGEVIAGMDVVDKISAVPKGPADRPTENIYMTAKVVEMTPAELKEKYGFMIP